jgi:hypothetical protein
MRGMSVWRKTLLLPVLSLALADVANSDVSGELDAQAELSPFYVRVGSYFLDSETTARVDRLGGNFGTRLDFEDDLNVDRHKDTLLAAARWRFADRHFLEIEYFNLKRSGYKRIDREISFGDSVFNVGADLNSSFSTEVTRLSYAYRIVRGQEWGLALSAGVHVTRLRASLDALVFDDANLPVLETEIASVTAPLPVFGVGVARRLGEKWAVVARGQWFFLEVDDVKGSISHGAMYVEHSTFKHVGFGVGYDWFAIDVDSTDQYWRGAVDVGYKGPMIFVQASF